MVSAPMPDVLQDTSTQPILAPLYRVLVHNDDKTPFDFVEAVLVRVFKLNRDRAVAVTKEADRSGVALVIVEPREHAEFHVEQAHSIARGGKFPLTFSMEPA
jgi:ATP-dependent Clp protease adaptor protein ClpS